MAKILVVDDEKDTLNLVATLLQKDAHQVVPCSGGQEALAFAQKERPDLILMDVTMPDMDGYTLVSHLASHEEARKIPVIMLTGKDGLRDMFQMFSNVVDFLNKPFDAKLLRARVQAALEKPAAQ